MKQASHCSADMPQKKYNVMEILVVTGQCVYLQWSGKTPPRNCHGGRASESCTDPEEREYNYKCFENRKNLAYFLKSWYSGVQWRANRGGGTEVARSQIMQSLINHGEKFGFHSSQQDFKQGVTTSTLSFKSSVKLLWTSDW